MKLLENIKKDFMELLPPMIFFFVAFVLILTTKRMILSEYQISWTGFGTAVVGAILAGKVAGICHRRRTGIWNLRPHGYRFAILQCRADKTIDTGDAGDYRPVGISNTISFKSGL